MFRVGRDVQVRASSQLHRLGIAVELYGGTAFQDDDQLVFRLVVPESRRGGMTFGDDPLDSKTVGLDDRRE